MTFLKATRVKVWIDVNDATPENQPIRREANTLPDWMTKTP